MSVSMQCTAVVVSGGGGPPGTCMDAYIPVPAFCFKILFMKEPG